MIRTRRTAVVGLLVLTGAGCAVTPADDRAASTGVPALRPSSAASSIGTECARGQIEIRWSPDHQSTPALCAHVGARIVVSLYPPELHQWTSPASTDVSVVTIGPVGLSQEGVLATTLIARRPGHAVITSSARPMQAAPSPGSVAWRLAIDVRA